MEPKVRKMAMVVNRVKMEDEDELDVLFWLNQPVLARLETVVSLRKITSHGLMAPSLIR
ncbi:hypothetical protein [Pedobacter psychrotolerans]|uniref:Uncharacterized protein n=2 Tax=Pedobacter psychrotolerans TaxID=1843235 RepID=A0ABQ1SJE8_9SPHI|nr:hypothetical protein [Pedobacter psychrotolerans]GGE42385.1 hypothetical protein GCM10011413_05390 [Pedobacter psychrotolerans]